MAQQNEVPDHHGQGAGHGPGGLPSHGAGHGHLAGHGHSAGHSHGHSAGHGHEHGHGGHSAADEAGLAEVLDLDAEVLHSYLAEVMALLAGLTAAAPPRRILDLGSGTGTGTLALLQQFTGAEVTAVDLSEEMLRRVTAKVGAAGIAGDRLRTVQADLDADWPGGLGPVDLVWASASLHHMADPDRALAELLAVLRPGGLLAVAEMDASPFPRFLSAAAEAALGRPGLEERLYTAVAGEHAEAVPHLGTDWGARLAAAGFAVESERRFDIRLTAPLPDATGRYAQATLRRLRDRLVDLLGAEDRAALAALLDEDGPQSILRRDDLTVVTSRTLWVARRPEQR
ncbi:class I SAM-dependent methyltransferase [Streptomyces cremeus]|uniref:Methyltransferase domain-containing protein n=1 Tax=Streptomyces cremeus TaxID=66881 RepID=A0ABV5PAY6_STRCM